MNLVCKECGSDINLPNKKFDRRHGKTHKIVRCPNCFAKNYVPILERYSEKNVFDTFNE